MDLTKLLNPAVIRVANTYTTPGNRGTIELKDDDGKIITPTQAGIFLYQDNTVIHFTNNNRESRKTYYFSIDKAIKSVKAIMVSPGKETILKDNQKKYEQGVVLLVSLYENPNFGYAGKVSQIVVDPSGGDVSIIRDIDEENKLIRANVSNIKNDFYSSQGTNNFAGKYKTGIAQRKDTSQVSVVQQDITKPFFVNGVQYKFGDKGGPGSAGGPGLVILLLEHDGAILRSGASSCSTNISLGSIGDWCVANSDSTSPYLGPSNMFKTNACLNAYISKQQDVILGKELLPDNQRPYIASENFLTQYNEQLSKNIVLFCGIVVVGSVLAKMMFFPIKM